MKNANRPGNGISIPVLISFSVVWLVHECGKTSVNLQSSRVVAQSLSQAGAPTVSAVPLAVGSRIDSIDDDAVLRALYGNYDSALKQSRRNEIIIPDEKLKKAGVGSGSGTGAYSGDATVLESADFEHGLQRQHILVTSTLLTGLNKKLVSAYVFTYKDGNWFFEGDYPYLEFLDTSAVAKVSFRQIGASKHALLEELKTRDALSLTLIELASGKGLSILQMQESIEDQYESLDITFRKSDHPYWNAVLTCSTSDANFYTLYRYKEGHYIPVKAVMRKIHGRAGANMFTRSATDWDGIEIRTLKETDKLPF